MDRFVHRVTALDFYDLATLAERPERLACPEEFAQLTAMDLFAYRPVLGSSASTGRGDSLRSSSLRSVGSSLRSASTSTASLIPAPAAVGSSTAAGVPPRVRRADRSALAAAITEAGDNSTAPTAAIAGVPCAVASATATTGGGAAGVACPGGAAQAAAAPHPTDGAGPTPGAAAVVGADVHPEDHRRDAADGSAGAGAAPRPRTPPGPSAAGAGTAAAPGEAALGAEPRTPGRRGPLYPATPTEGSPGGRSLYSNLSAANTAAAGPCRWVADFGRSDACCGRLRTLRLGSLLPDRVVGDLLARCGKLQRLDAARVDKLADAVSERRSRRRAADSRRGRQRKGRGAQGRQLAAQGVSRWPRPRASSWGWAEGSGVRAVHRCCGTSSR